MSYYDTCGGGGCYYSCFCTESYNFYIKFEAS